MSLQKLKAIREAAQISSRFLSKETGISLDSIEQFELGKAMPSVQQIVSICNFYGLSPRDLVQGEVNQILPSVFRFQKTGEVDFSDHTLKALLWARRLVINWEWIRTRLRESNQQSLVDDINLDRIERGRVRREEIHEIADKRGVSDPHGRALIVREYFKEYFGVSGPIKIHALCYLLGSYLVMVKLPRSVKVDGFFFPEKSFDVIVVNKTARPANYESFIVGHEIYHLIFDSGNTQEVTQKVRANREIELEADAFSRELLLPLSIVKSGLSNLKKSILDWRDRYCLTKSLILSQLVAIGIQDVADDFKRLAKKEALFRPRSPLNSNELAAGVSSNYGSVPNKFRLEVMKALEIGLISEARSRDLLSAPDCS